MKERISVASFPKHILHQILAYIGDAPTLLAFSSTCSLTHLISQEQSTFLWVSLLQRDFLNTPHSDSPQSSFPTWLSPKQAYIQAYERNRPVLGVGDSDLQSNRAYIFFIAPFLIYSALHLASVEFYPRIWACCEGPSTMIGLGCIANDEIKHTMRYKESINKLFVCI